MLFLVRDIIDAARGEPETELDVRKALAELADDLNSNLSGYEVRMTHLDLDDYLEFIQKETAK